MKKPSESRVYFFNDDDRGLNEISLGFSSLFAMPMSP
jgi:hypothetical protein